jgi:hypothetical protein
MKEKLTKLCWPVLKFFETGEQTETYQKSHRLVLNIVGALFLFLSTASAVTAYISGEIGALIPVIVFLSIGVVAIIVGLLGSDSAVSKIWGKK